MKMYGVMLTEKNWVMKVLAENEEAARSEAERQLNRLGRYGILRQWKENGKMVKELTWTIDTYPIAAPCDRAGAGTQGGNIATPPPPGYQRPAASPTGARPAQSRVRESDRGGWREALLRR